MYVWNGVGLFYNASDFPSPHGGGQSYEITKVSMRPPTTNMRRGCRPRWTAGGRGRSHAMIKETQTARVFVAACVARSCGGRRDFSLAVTRRYFFNYTRVLGRERIKSRWAAGRALYPGRRRSSGVNPPGTVWCRSPTGLSSDVRAGGVCAAGPRVRVRLWNLTFTASLFGQSLRVG